MRVELPEGYVPPPPTHPHYGYLTPRERAELEAAESEEAGIVPSVPAEPDAPGLEEPGEPESEPEPERPLEPSAGEPAAETLAGPTGWVPEAPSPPAGPELRWDAYRQEWVGEEAAPPPDVAAAAGGRGASSSWTSADGQRFRWDSRAQEWVTERADG